MNLVAAELALAGLALLSVVFALVRTGRLGRGAQRTKPVDAATADRIARVRAARDARFGRRRR